MTKLTKWHMRPAKTQISLGIRPVWSKSLLSAWRKLGSLDTHWAHSEDSDQTGQRPRLIWVFAGPTVILLILSWGGSYWIVRSRMGFPSTSQPPHAQEEKSVLNEVFSCFPTFFFSRASCQTVSSIQFMIFAHATNPHTIWASSWENLFLPYVTNKGTGQPAHPRSLISCFVVRC